MKRDIYADITNRIVAAIESSPGDPIMPWHRGGATEVPTNIETGREYQGVNILNLWVIGQLTGYTASVWGTYRQWQNAGCQVRKGEKASPIVFYKTYEQEGDDGDIETRRAIRSYSVFNADQVDGYTSPEIEMSAPLDRLEGADRALRATGATIVEAGARAFYQPSTDTIHMPDGARFIDTMHGTRTENFYAILLHELTHWTGHPDRCNRELGSRFGSEAYAMEELVAELGAAFLCARLDITPVVRDDHAQYLANWLEVLKNDKRAIFAAAAKAQVAVDFIL